VKRVRPNAASLRPTSAAGLAIQKRPYSDHCATHLYPHEVQGIVVDLDPHAAVVCVHRQTGRFKSGEIRCRPLVLDRLNPAA
jgi:hypothetical protein